ncbi:MAG: TPM domain-containing protein, partial [Gemmatimonadales bacterium]
RIAVPRQSAAALRSVRGFMGVETVNAPAQGDSLRGTRAKAIALWMGLQLSAGFSPAVTPGWAQAIAVDSLVPAQPVGYVNDFASVVSGDAAQSMDDLIRRLQGVTGAELAVVTLPTIGDREASEVALAIGRKWKVGAKAEIGDPRRNAGLVLLLVPRREGDPNSGQIRIEVGQGLEGIVTDAAAGQIRDLMRPELSQGNYGEGLLLGVRALASLIARGYGVSDTALTAYQPPVGSGGGRPTGGNLLPLLLMIFFLLMISGAFRGGRRRRSGIYWGGPWIGGGWGGGGGFGGGGGGFGGFGGGGGFSGGGAGGRF